MTPSADIAAILSHRHDSGGDHWASADGGVYVGNPFSTIGALLMLHELGVGGDHEAVRGGLDRILDACRDDGRIKVGRRSPMYPCYTSEAARVLARYDVDDPAIERTMAWLLDNAHDAGGWRCSFSRFGKGPETEFANPGATLYALDFLRFQPELRTGHAVIDAAVESLLDHWVARAPRGPCHWGIGSMFLRVEYPFLRYNLFFWVYVLSHFDAAAGDPRFEDARATLEAKLDDGSVVVEHRHRALKGLSFCAKGEPSEPATARWREIVANVA